MNKKIKKCEICDDEFETKYSHQKYCEKCGKDPDKMRDEYNRSDARMYWNSKPNDIDMTKYKHICITCDKEYLSPYGFAGNCSDSCKKEYKIKTARCSGCGANLSEHGNNTGKGFCSEDCKQKNHYKIKKNVLPERE